MLAKRFPTFLVKENRVDFFIPNKEETCVETFPPCPEIRCEKPIHSTGVCYAVNLDPYYSIYWQSPDKLREGK